MNTLKRSHRRPDLAFYTKLSQLTLTFRGSSDGPQGYADALENFGAQYPAPLLAAKRISTASEESTHTVHRLSMLTEITASTNSRTSDVSLATTASNASSSGYLALLDTYANIMDQIGDLVPHGVQMRSNAQAAVQRKIIADGRSIRTKASTTVLKINCLLEMLEQQY
ncbi:hypothetical protein HDU83_006595 [Entophlyctis luteolus]|nr:hypothetical protein HDU82_006668 [Entophlyctis luteolus]KAJ3341488.1 hypothetical protein HDU83_006595 [Entophlyctis luteolus]